MKHAIDVSARPLDPPPARRTPRHAVASAEMDRRVVAVLVAMLAAALLAGVLLWPASPPPDGSPAPAAGWDARLAELYDARAEAFASGDSAALAEVYTLDSRQLRSDTETIESLAAQQRSVVGFVPRLIEVESVQESAEVAVAVVRDEIRPFTIVDESGAELTVAGRAPSRVVLQLRRVGGSWLLVDATRTAG